MKVMISVEVRQGRFPIRRRQLFNGLLREVDDFFNHFDADIACRRLSHRLYLNKHAHFINLKTVMLGQLHYPEAAITNRLQQTIGRQRHHRFTCGRVRNP